MRYSFTVISLVLACSVTAQSPLPADVQAHIEQQITSGLSPSIAIGIVDDEGMRYFNYGLTKKGGKKVDEHTIYEIGSVSKVFTGIILADMALEGRVSIDSPAQKYLPTSVQMPGFHGHQITLGELADHTSSLPRMPDNFDPADPMNPYADYTADQMYAFLASYQLKREIGSEYEYSNLAQGLLGQILAMVADTDYETLMQLKIATPLEMYETAVDLTTKMERHLAYGHTRGAQVPNWDLPTFAGAGGIRSSVYDMLRFVAANLGRIESPVYPAMVLSHQVRHDKNGSGVGLGWHTVKGPEGPIVTHNGKTGGYTAFIGFVKETGKGVVVLTNGDAGIEEIGMRLLGVDLEFTAVRPHIAMLMGESINTEGVEGLDARFQDWKRNYAESYDFGEMDINSLGYYYLGTGNLEAARAIFRINTIEYPGSSNVWDSYGEALLASGDTIAAIENYEKSLELNPGNENAVMMLELMGVEAERVDVDISIDVLSSYVGKYQLAPGAIIDVTLDVTLDGFQLKVQLTGQPAFEIYPASQTSFYLKVVVARIDFNKNEMGKVESLTLFQNGMETIAPKVE